MIVVIECVPTLSGLRQGSQLGGADTGGDRCPMRQAPDPTEGRPRECLRVTGDLGGMWHRPLGFVPGGYLVCSVNTGMGLESLKSMKGLCEFMENEIRREVDFAGKKKIEIPACVCCRGEFFKKSMKNMCY